MEEVLSSLLGCLLIFAAVAIIFESLTKGAERVKRMRK